MFGTEYFRRRFVVAVLVSVLGVLVFGCAAAWASPEAPESLAPKPVFATTAILHGVLDPKSGVFPVEGGTYEFLYKATKTVTRAECESAGASRAPAPAGAYSGFEPEVVSQEVTALTPETAYVVCLSATNTKSETTVSAPVAFKTVVAVAPEAPEVSAPSEVKAESATLNGVVNPKITEPVESGTYEFLYKASKVATKAECESGAKKAPVPPGTYTGAEPQAVAAPVSGLTQDTEYVVCLAARNAGATTVGAPVAFKTATKPETPTTVAASGETASTAVLHGILDPNSTLKAGGHFAYSNPGGASCGEGPKFPLEGFVGETEIEALAVHSTVTGLQPHQKYVFCLVATNSLGEAVPGNEVSFETSAEGPTLAGESASAVTSKSATLEAQINPNNQVTEYVFEYSTKVSGETLEGAIAKRPGLAPLSGFGPQTASVETGAVLAQNTAYYYRAIAKNAKGEEAIGRVERFTTQGEPFYLDVSASAVRQTTATLNASIDPGGLESAYHFEYGTSTAYGTSTPTANTGAGTGGVVVAQHLSALQPATTYHYRIIATNTSGTNVGVDHAFTTLPSQPPVVSTGEALGVAASSATISGIVETQGYETRYEFDLGADTSYGSRIFGQAEVPAGSQTFTVAVQGLQPGTTYHYRILATNTFGIVYGIDRTFTTPAVPAAALIAPIAPALTPAPPLAALTTATKPKLKPKHKSKAKKKKKHGKTRKPSHGKGRK
jgi:hypothetical protein